eukprot:snap_masked-scaffold_30-processed-gene-3.89-mRNA-1 protein AED:1.00 eAED:1.00 QI:0/0/0/0/1/1/2/0/79
MLSQRSCCLIEEKIRGMFKQRLSLFIYVSINSAKQSKLVTICQIKFYIIVFIIATATLFSISQKTLGTMVILRALPENR